MYNVVKDSPRDLSKHSGNLLLLHYKVILSYRDTIKYPQLPLFSIEIQLRQLHKPCSQSARR